MIFVQSNVRCARNVVCVTSAISDHDDTAVLRLDSLNYIVISKDSASNVKVRRVESCEKNTGDY